MSTRRTPISAKPPKKLKILFADDERSLQELMKLELPRLGHEVTVCPDGLTAVVALEMNSYDCVMVDLDMPELSGIEVIAKAKALSPDTECIIMTGKSSLETAVAALRHGVFDYLTKPCKLIELQSLLERVADKREWANRYRALRHQLNRAEGTPKLIGDSASMKQVKALIAKVAPTESTVLVRGETGAGKELVARAVHEQSARCNKPFVAVNCGALPETLIESELFGHRKGSFTGADEHRIGLFEVASGGTIFLDEIGELPKPVQAKLLRVLESGEIRRLGENQNIEIDVRVVCATHRDLEEMVQHGEFREDLLFRINTFEIFLPPLRDRVDDIPQLVFHLAKRLRPKLRKLSELFTDDAIEVMQAHPWSGNVRELANVVEHSLILAGEEKIGPEHLPRRFGDRPLREAVISALPSTTLRDLETQAILQALDRCHGSKPAAARELGISLKTLYNKLSQETADRKSA